VCIYIWTEREIKRETDTERDCGVLWRTRAHMAQRVRAQPSGAQAAAAAHGHRPPPGTTPHQSRTRCTRARAPQSPYVCRATHPLYIYAHTKIKHHLRPCRCAAACCCTCAPPSQAGRNDDDNNDDDDKTRVHPPHPHPTPHPTVCDGEWRVCWLVG
jgi:hypothetical protein